LAELKTELQSAEGNFQEKLEEVDVQLQAVAKEWDTAVEANADAAARKKLFARMNDLLNRRSTSAISSQALKRSSQRNAW